MWASLFTGKLANLLTAFVNIFLLLFNTHPVDTSKPQIDLNNYTLVFADEFDGDSLNKAVWHTHNSNGIRKGGYWSDKQASVKDGKLVIRTEYLENGDFGAGWYTAGLSTSNTFEQKNGYFECRCILPKGQGLWSAFWLNNGNINQVNGNGYAGAEIDVFESPFGYKKGSDSWKITSNIHYNGYELQTKYKNVGIYTLDNDPYENFNTYGVLWTEDEYIFYVNGHETGRTDFGGVSREPEFLILSCEVDGAAATPTRGWSGIITSNPEGNAFSSEFVVDYVRVYK